MTTAHSNLANLPRRRWWLPSRQTLPFIATLVVLVVMYVIGCLRYDHFSSVDTFLEFFRSNAGLGVAALGATFVILSGGIDLSVGAVIAFTSIVLASLIQRGMHPLCGIAIVLFLGMLAGAIMGALIHFFALTPFLVTLGGLYTLRGIALIISHDDIQIDHPFYDRMTEFYIQLPGNHSLTLNSIVFIVLAIILILISRHTAFGRNVYAIGGNEQSATLMGLPVGRTKITVYALAGMCSALASVVYTLDTPKGSAIQAQGKELEAIASVVMGGTLLSGGIGFVAGTPLGVMVYGIIQTALNNEQNLNSSWLPIAVSALLLAFLVIQRLMQRRKAR